MATDHAREVGEGCEAHQPTFRWADGLMVTRDQVQQWLRRAALATGMPPERLGSHSLRIGGACALYHHCKDLERVRRFGRWATAVFHVYLWETSGDSTGMAEGMARPQGVLLAARGLGARATGGVSQHRG